MRIAVVSDLHANLQAWLAVSSDLAQQHVERIFSLGDLVGYGPNPIEICLLFRERAVMHLLGNHDAAVCGRTRLDRWNAHAIRSIEWTRKKLKPELIEWLETLPLTQTWGPCRFAHSEFSAPEAFYYIQEPKHALRSWRVTKEPLLFVGHTHRPALYVLGASGVPHVIEPQPFIMEPGKRYLVNVGSVGFPRERLNVASYCIFDSTEGSVRWRSVNFDCNAYRMALRAYGFDDPRKGEFHDEPD